jgi:hypothetical protein
MWWEEYDWDADLRFILIEADLAHPKPTGSLGED